MTDQCTCEKCVFMRKQPYVGIILIHVTEELYPQFEKDFMAFAEKYDVSLEDGCISNIAMMINYSEAEPIAEYIALTAAILEAAGRTAVLGDGSRVDKGDMKSAAFMALLKIASIAARAEEAKREGQKN